MSDTPLADALKNIPQNELNIDGGIGKTDGAGLHGSLERDLGNTSFGIEGGVTQRKGWSIAGFFKKVWK